MYKKIRWKFTLIGVLIAASIVVIAPSVTKNLPPWWSRLVPGEGLHLGLDLQGGMSLILKVDLAKAIRNQINLSFQDLEESLRGKDLRITDVQQPEEDRLTFVLPDKDQVTAVRESLMEDAPALKLISETPQQDGIRFELALQEKEVHSIDQNAISESLEIIRNRIDQFGVSEPVIVRQGKDEIVVQLPGVKDPQRALDLIGKTAQLEFKLVDSEAQPDLEEWIHQVVRSGTLKKGYTHQELNGALADRIPPDTEIYIQKHLDPETGRVTRTPILLFRKTLMAGDAVKTAKVEIGGRLNEPYVTLQLNARGRRIFDQITRENVGRQLAIILDDVVQSAPVIEERISGGNAQITGAFTMEEAHDLAIVLRAGALPAPVSVVQNVTVGPSLGQDSIHKGLLSGLLGTALVVLFMIYYYRFSGLIADFALVLNVLFLMAALTLFQATLTLPGIAGIILSIGMAVDSNVLIFERMREEFGRGKPLRSGIEGGYDKALWTIVDAHVTTLITALALFLFGSGPIKGFAVTLSIGVVFNLFTALFCTRTVYDHLSLGRRLRMPHFVEFLKQPGIDFIGMRRFAFALSAVLVSVGLIALVQINRGKANLGVDFSGGTMAQFKSEQPFQLDQVRSALGRGGFKDVELQRVTGENSLIVRIRKSNQAVGRQAGAIGQVLQKDFPESGFVMESQAEIGASVSAALKRAALTAIFISLVGMVVYLAWRFEFRFGVAATVATFHDVLAVLGIFFLLHKEVTLLTVTALLTLAGYSLTDTVVVFDRIRENMRRPGKKDFGDVINLSINEVLSRTIITSLTVFLVLLALFFFGGTVLHDFALALLIGVVVGSYSSVFVASPIVYAWPGRRGKHKSVAKARAH
jgi:SecD/SecF fusion protein